MASVVVFGGCGQVGGVAVKTLAKSGHFEEIVICDLNGDRAGQLIKEAGPKVSYKRTDLMDAEAVKRAAAGKDVALNCSGPFYKLVKTVLAAVIEAGVNYVDICDDVDVTLEVLAMDEKARAAGVTALIGMGSSPGATNLLAKFAADNLLDETESIDIFHAHGGEPLEGEGVIGHRFHCMSIDIPMYLDGELKKVKYFEEDGVALRESFAFPVIGEVLLYPYPHPEQVTLPNYVKCKRVTNKGSVLPDRYYELIRDMCGLGLSQRDPVTVKGVQISPYDFSMAYIIRERERILRETDFGPQRGCASVVVKGKKDGKKTEYRFHMASRSQALGEGTGVPAAVGAILMALGKVKGQGVAPPEAMVDPMDFIGIVPKVMDLDSKKEEGESFGGVIVERIDENGKVTKLDI